MSEYTPEKVTELKFKSELIQFVDLIFFDSNYGLRDEILVLHDTEMITTLMVTFDKDLLSFPKICYSNEIILLRGIYSGECSRILRRILSYCRGLHNEGDPPEVLSGYNTIKIICVGKGVSKKIRVDLNRLRKFHASFEEIIYSLPAKDLEKLIKSDFQNYWTEFIFFLFTIMLIYSSKIIHPVIEKKPKNFDVCSFVPINGKSQAFGFNMRGIVQFLNSDETKKGLNGGALLFCPDCHLFNNDFNVCRILRCENPFSGPSKGEESELSKELVTKLVGD